MHAVEEIRHAVEEQNHNLILLRGLENLEIYLCGNRRIYTSNFILYLHVQRIVFGRIYKMYSQWCLPLKN